MEPNYPILAKILHLMSIALFGLALVGGVLCLFQPIFALPVLVLFLAGVFTGVIRP